MPISFDGTARVPETLPRLPCGGLPRWDYASGYAYRCEDCGAIIGSIGQSDECNIINKLHDDLEEL